MKPSERDELRKLRAAAAALLAELERINGVADDAERGRALRELMRVQLQLVEGGRRPKK